MSRSTIFTILVALLFSITFLSAQDSANRQTYLVQGIIQQLPPDGKTVIIQHEAVTNYMPAMTMPFEVHDTNELRDLHPGDTINFQMVIAGDNAWIEHLTKLHSTNSANQPLHLGFHLVRDVDLLKIGDPLPEYHFTNQLGQAISTKQLLGQAFAFTFFFVRCPYPTFCPLMSRNFEETQQKLLAMPGAATNWQLLSISFDTENDSPAELAGYAKRYHYQPTHWQFLTGDLTEITAIGDQVGEYFGHDTDGGITHNLRTVVIDPRGHIQKIFTDNKWTPEELAAEILNAAQTNTPSK